MTESQNSPSISATVLRATSPPARLTRTSIRPWPALAATSAILVTWAGTTTSACTKIPFPCFASIKRSVSSASAWLLR